MRAGEALVVNGLVGRFGEDVVVVGGASVDVVGDASLDVELMVVVVVSMKTKPVWSEFPSVRGGG